MIRTSLIAAGLMVLGCLSQRPVEAPADAMKLRTFLKPFLSEKYIDEHFQFRGTYKSPVGTVTLSYNLTYGNMIARTRTAGSVDGRMTSGITRISPEGKIESYFGPLKEYELKVSKEKAEGIMRAQRCTFARDVSSSPAQGELAAPTIELFIGDYWEKEGKYSPDYIKEGFYWVGGRPGCPDKGIACVVDAQTGAFSTQQVAPY